MIEKNWNFDSIVGINHIKSAGIILHDRFLLIRKIGIGSFGQIYQALDKQSDERVAVKIEKIKNRESCSLIQLEADILQRFQNDIGFAKLYGWGSNCDYNYMIMTQLGHNFEYLIKKNKKLTYKCAALIFYQAMERIEQFHQKDLIHRDIKPENFIMGINDKRSTVYLIDFGLSKTYKNDDGTHIMFQQRNGLIGTARYASVGSHKGIEQSRRDDLQSLGYLFIYLLKGFLPWQNLQINDRKEKFLQIMKIKENISNEQLCEDLPIEIFKYIEYVMKLGFQQNPDYEFMKNLFLSLFNRAPLDQLYNDFFDQNCEQIQQMLTSIQKDQQSCQFDMDFDEKVNQNKTLPLAQYNFLNNQQNISNQQIKQTINIELSTNISEQAHNTPLIQTNYHFFHQINTYEINNK